MFVSWVLMVLWVFFFVVGLTLFICYWKKIPPLLRWVSGLNALILLANILSLGLTIEQQNTIQTTHYHRMEQRGFIEEPKELRSQISNIKTKKIDFDN